MKSPLGIPLRHFTKEPSPLSAGINVFAQDISKENNPYVFPPFVLILPLLKFLKEQQISHLWSQYFQQCQYGIHTYVHFALLLFSSVEKEIRIY